MRNVSRKAPQTLFDPRQSSKEENFETLFQKSETNIKVREALKETADFEDIVPIRETIYPPFLISFGHFHPTHPPHRS